MKIKRGFLLQDVAGETVVLPVDADLNMNMMITLNDTGKFIWELLEEDTSEEAIVTALCAEYDVDAETAAKCVSAFIAKLNGYGFLA